MRHLAAMTVLSILALAVLAPAAEPATGYQFPRAVVPYVGKAPPKMDGRVSPGEYDNAAAIGGMVAWGGAATGKTLVADMQQVVWYVGYDEKYLYISMRSPNPPGVWPLARVKTNDGGNPILWDDHVEIQIAKDRSRATFPGTGFYKITANPRGFLNDEWYHNGTPGTEGEWSIGGSCKCSVTQEHWDMEIAIDVRSFDVKSLDGQAWVLQLLRADSCGGVYFAGWVGGHWMMWNEFGQVTFSRTAPALQFRQPLEMVGGHMKLDLGIIGQTDQAVPVTLAVRVKDGQGKLVFDKSQTLQAVAGKVQTASFEQDLPISDENNELEILATYPQPGEEGEQAATAVAYHVRAPFKHFTKEFFDQHVGPWLAARPKGDLAWQFAYWPSRDVADTSVDVDFYGIAEELAGATAFEVTVAPKAGGKPLAGQRVEIRDRKGSMVLKGLKLPDGEYTATLRVLGPDGKKVVDTRTLDFIRRGYAWEGNHLGMGNKVYAPFEPVKVDQAGRKLSVWARTYEVSDDGLLKQIVAGTGAGDEPILAAPMRLEADAGGKTVTMENAKLRFGVVEPGHVELSATGKLGPAECRVDAYAEYDGWYNVRLTLDPGAKPATLDRLRLRIPLWSAADTLYAQRHGDGRRGNRFGAVPDGNGVVWSSADLLPIGDYWGSFCPIVYLGNGDKGLWCFADDVRSWTLSQDTPAVEVVRVDGGVELVLNILADTTKLDGPRTVEFAFLIDPVKDIPERRKWEWGVNVYAHNTYGYRYYGDSVDGYECTDEDLAALTAMLTDPDWKTPQMENPKGLNSSKAFRQTMYPLVSAGKMLTLYGSTSLTGLGLPAFDTYGGEWLGRTNWTPAPQTEFRNSKNLQGTYEWKTPRDLTTVGVNFTPSYEDCFVWHHQRLLAGAPVNGTWWDNSSITQIRDYDPATGEFYKRFNVFTRRRLMKRLFNVGHELGRRPWWISNMHVDWSFNQVAWHVENDFYTDNAAATLLDQLSVDEFRAMCRIKRGICHRYHHACHDRNITNEQVRRKGRSVVGMCLLHDIGNNRPWGGDDTWLVPSILEILQDKVGFLDGAEFVGYWRSVPLVKIDTPGVYASVYSGKDRALICVVNANREDTDVRFTLGKGILGGRAVKKIYDAETGIPFGSFYDAKIRQRVPGEFLLGTFGMKPHDFRLLVVE